MSKEIMSKCCGLCPYSRKDTLFLRAARAEDFASSAENPYNDFVCHKTGVSDNDDSGSIVRGAKSLTCAGFYAMQFLINSKEGQLPKIKIDYEDHFSDYWEMTEHHENNQK